MSNPTETVVNAAPTIVDQFLSKSLEYLSSAEAFLKAEVPAFIQEFMTWKFYEALFYFGLWVIPTIVACSIGVFSYRKYKNTGVKDNLEFATFIITVGFLALFINSLVNLPVIIKLKVAPRVFLLEEVRSLTK